MQHSGFVSPIASQKLELNLALKRVAVDAKVCTKMHFLADC